MKQIDLLKKTSKEINKLRTVPLDKWFLAKQQPGVKYFQTARHRDFHRAFVETGSFGNPKVISIESFVAVLGEQFRQYITYLPGLENLIGRSGGYVPDWIYEFYATVWIAPDHSHIAFSFLGRRVTVGASEFRDIFNLRESPIRIHDLCFPNIEPPRYAHAGMLPPVDVMRPCFKGDFGFGSSRLPADLTPIARGLNSIVRHTILPRTGYRNGFTRLQQWIVSHLVRQIEFDIWDLLISDIEDVIYGSFGRT